MFARAAAARVFAGIRTFDGLTGSQAVNFTDVFGAEEIQKTLIAENNLAVLVKNEHEFGNGIIQFMQKFIVTEQPGLQLDYLCIAPQW
jgi:hypothetical protein